LKVSCAVILPVSTTKDHDHGSGSGHYLNCLELSCSPPENAEHQILLIIDFDHLWLLAHDEVLDDLPEYVLRFGIHNAAHLEYSFGQRLRGQNETAAVIAFGYWAFQ
jgi:hypothetical protein